MSRSNYTDDFSDNWSMICWRGAVNSAIKGKRGQQFFKELLLALDDMPIKELIDLELQNDSGQFCTIGALGKARGLDMKEVDPDDADTVSKMFGIAPALAREIVFMNDEASSFWDNETTKKRWQRMREWVAEQIINPPEPKT